MDLIGLTKKNFRKTFVDIRNFKETFTGKRHVLNRYSFYKEVLSTFVADRHRKRHLLERYMHCVQKTRFRKSLVLKKYFFVQKTFVDIRMLKKTFLIQWHVPNRYFSITAICWTYRDIMAVDDRSFAEFTPLINGTKRHFSTLNVPIIHDWFMILRTTKSI